MSDSPPASIVSRLGGPSTWEPFGHRRWLAAAGLVYRCASTAEADRTLAAMALTSNWWPKVVIADGSWIATERPAGEGAHRPERHGEIGGLAELAGHSLRALHATALPEAGDDDAAEPDHAGWEAIAKRVASSTVDVASLPEPFRRYSRDRLIELWRQGRPGEDDRVMCHGQPRLEYLFVDAGVVAGWVEPRHAASADRHLDLAVAHRSIQACLGNDAVFRFYEAYGSDPSLPAIEHYLLADLLIS